MASSEHNTLQTFTVTFSIEQWNIIGEALGGMPYARVAPIINALNTQFQNQVEAEKHKNPDEKTKQGES